MGGLVARELEFNHPGAIKGIVTIGTPHQGAPVVRNIFAGQAGLLAERVINRIKLSVSSSTVAIQFSIFPGTKSRIITNMTKNYAIGSAVMDLGMFILKVPYQYMDEMRSQVGAQCARDMIPNSPYMATIAKRNVNVPILTFACEEDSWQLARLGFCSKNKSTLQTSRTANAQGSYDNGGVAEMKKWRNGFQTVGGVHTAAAVVFGVVGWWNPRYWVASAANGVAAVNWFSNARYINSGLDYDNAIFVGASHVRAVKHRILWVTWYTHETVADPHDGVVPVSSQQLDKTKGTEVIWATKTITGVNHMEEFNHPNTRKEFTLLFAGNSYKQRFFAR
jgi:hypothetical protein